MANSNINIKPISEYIPAQSIIDSYLDDDYKLITDNKEWKQLLINKENGDTVSIIKHKDDSIWWIKAIGEIHNISLDNVDNLLDDALKERQIDWHRLYITGDYIYTHSPTVEICYFQYKSPVFLVSPRDTCYFKFRRDYYDENKNLSGFLLSYRSIEIPNEPRIHVKGFVRTTFSGFNYCYIQHADSGGSIPKMFANKPQCEIMLKEVAGVREATKKAIIPTTRFQKFKQAIAANNENNNNINDNNNNNQENKTE